MTDDELKAGIGEYFKPWRYSDADLSECLEALKAGKTWTQRCSLGDLKLTLNKLVLYVAETMGAAKGAKDGT